jgi:hypothetical protein
MAIILLNTKQQSAGALTKISGSTGVDFTHTFADYGLVVAVIFFSALPLTFTLRQFGDVNTDMEVNMPGGVYVAANILMPVYNLANIQFLNISANSLEYTIYLN